MLTDAIKKEWRDKPKDFFELKEIPRHCRAITKELAYRWLNRGIKISRDEKVKPLRLEAIKRGGRWLTTTTAVQRFLDKTIGGLA